MIRYTIVPTRWGGFGFVSRQHRLVATFLPRPAESVRRAIRRSWPAAVEDPNAMPRFRRQVIDYFAGKRVRFNVDLDLTDQTAFRSNVLASCRRIPYGQTASYGDLAGAVGKPKAARAVGGAMAHNPLPLVIPCHRVVASDGSLGGFSSPEGIRQKKRLLQLEHAPM